MLFLRSVRKRDSLFQPVCRISALVVLHDGEGKIDGAAHASPGDDVAGHGLRGVGQDRAGAGKQVAGFPSRSPSAARMVGAAQMAQTSLPSAANF